MLWQKVLEDGNYFYVDIFDKYRNVPSYYAEGLHVKSHTKNEAVALKCSSTWHSCIKLSSIDAMAATMTITTVNPFDGEKIAILNRALCFAESELTLKRCYTLRADGFLKLKKYRMCLNDIKLAEKLNIASPYDTQLRELRANCEALLEINASETMSPIEIPKLSTPSATIPCFAEGLKVQQSKKFGKHVLTDRDLQIGETVIVEKAFYISSGGHFLACANCLRIDVNLIPCKNCSLVMFCSDACHESGHRRFHSFECGIKGLDGPIRGVLLSVVEAIKLFPNVKDMMEAVASFIDGSPTTNMEPSIRAYKQFFVLNHKFGIVPFARLEHSINVVKWLQFIISSDSTYKSSFQSVEASRFLAHLILHHYYVHLANNLSTAMTFSLPCLHAFGMAETSNGVEKYAFGTYLNSSYLNHSCEPNIAYIFSGEQVIGKVIRPIKRGEQLFVSYLQPGDLALQTDARKNVLKDNQYFNCRCTRCTSIAPSATQKISCAGVGMCHVLGINNYVRENVKELLKLEKSAKEILEANAHLKVDNQILNVQNLLIQIWDILHQA